MHDYKFIPYGNRPKVIYILIMRRGQSVLSKQIPCLHNGSWIKFDLYKVLVFHFAFPSLTSVPSFPHSPPLKKKRKNKQPKEKKILQKEQQNAYSDSVMKWNITHNSSPQPTQAHPMTMMHKVKRSWKIDTKNAQKNQLIYM